MNTEKLNEFSDKNNLSVADIKLIIEILKKEQSIRKREQVLLGMENAENVYITWIDRIINTLENLIEFGRELEKSLNELINGKKKTKKI